MTIASFDMISANAFNFNKSNKILSTGKVFNSLPNKKKILDWSKLKELADDNFYLVQIMIYVFDRVENIVGKGENAGYQHFLLFPQCFQKFSF